jgi:resuscitation-promoting factor RpfB
LYTHRSRYRGRARGGLTAREALAATAAGLVIAWMAHHAGAGTGTGGDASAAGAAQMSTASANVALGKRLAAADGWGSGSQWSCLDALWTRESGWRSVWNYQGSGAYGIPQSLPASKMAAAGSDYMTNPATQIRWGLGYIASTYGTPCGAWSHETTDGWY